MTTYIPIKNELYGKYTSPEESKIYQIKSVGFYILSYLIYESNGKDNLNTNKLFIGEYLNLDIRTVTKYLLLLEENNIISCSQDIQKKNKNALLEISLKKYNNLTGGYELIPSEIFTTYRKVISDKGWLILCLITKMANFNLGSGYGVAYANVSKEFLRKQIGVDKETISNYTNILQEQKLIQITPRKNISLPEGEHCYVSKIYKVLFKVDSRKGKKTKKTTNEEIPKIPT